MNYFKNEALKQAVKDGFKPIKGFDNYMINESGQVYSIKRAKLLRPANNGKNYLFVNIINNEGKKRVMLIHRLLFETFKGEIKKDCVIDHIDNNPLNNDLNNLQQITFRENLSKDKKNGTSKYTGVCWSKWMNKYKSSIRVNNKEKFIGYFSNEKDAAKAYQYELSKLNS